MMDLESIQHATTFLQWHKGNCYNFKIKPSLHFTQWDSGGWSLVHWRSQHAWEVLYQNENSGSSSSEVKETDVGGFPYHFISILLFQPNFIICLFCFQFVIFSPLRFCHFPI